MTEAAAAHPSPATTFDALELSEDVRKAITDMGYSTPTPVQAAVLDPIRRGKSIVVQARTGTGKTAAFGLPIIDSLIRKGQPELQALILVPTRELALQVAGELEKLGKYRGTKIAAVYGGASMERQVAELAGGAQIVVGTPGRVLDHLRRGTMAPKSIRIFVLDEADEMLSMGFAKELNAIIELLPKERQGLYFSATIAPDIERLANRHLRDPEYVTLSSDQIGALEISHYVYVLRGGLDRREALAKIIEVEDPESAVVFCNTRDETERLARQAIATGRLGDCLAPFDAGRQAESLLDALGVPRAFPRSLHRIQSVSLVQALKGTDDLARAAALWDNAFREEMSRSMVPSLDVLRSLVNTGRHVYAVSARAALHSGSEAEPERLAALRDAGSALAAIEQNWPKVATTLVGPGHAFIGASRDLYVALTVFQKELKTRDPRIDLESTDRSLSWLADRASQHVAENSRLPERLLKSGLVFAPAGTVRPTPARLPARTKRRFTAADTDDYPTFVTAWQRAEGSARAVRGFVYDPPFTLGRAPALDAALA
mgnify:CR=1 FL=1